MAPKEKLQQLRIYISHGINDTVLPVHGMHRNAVAFLTSLDLTPTFNEYPAGHQLNTAMHADLVEVARVRQGHPFKRACSARKCLLIGYPLLYAITAMNNIGSKLSLHNYRILYFIYFWRKE